MKEKEYNGSLHLGDKHDIHHISTPGLSPFSNLYISAKQVIMYSKFHNYNVYINFIYGSWLCIKKTHRYVSDICTDSNG